MTGSAYVLPVFPQKGGEGMSLQEQRQKAGFSQQSLSDAAQVNIWVIRSYESGKRDINGASLDILCKLAITLGCKISDIITDDGIKKMLEECT